MNFDLTDEQRSIRDTARAFLRKEVLPLENEFLRRQRSGEEGLTRDELRALQQSARRFGFWGMGTPEEYGGMGLPAVEQSLLHTEVARSAVPFRFGGEADNILFSGTEEQQEEYLLPTIEGDRISCFALTEPGAGSDAANISTRARRDGGDWVISGEKTFITQGHDADFAIVVAVTDAERGARHGSTAFIVDRGMGWTSSPIPVMGWETPASLVLDEVRVPERNVLGEVGHGFDLAMRWIGRGRYVISAQAVGIAERCLEMAIEHARTRRTFGKPLAEHQAIQWMIADSEVDLEAGRWLALRAAWSMDTGADADARHAASVSKLFAASMVNRVVDRVLQVHGGMGYTRELPIEHWYRAVRVFRIFEGSDEMQRLIVSRDLLRGFTRVGAHLA
jgi:acyl-CoA dehydrogenase